MAEAPFSDCPHVDSPQTCLKHHRRVRYRSQELRTEFSSHSRPRVTRSRDRSPNDRARCVLTGTGYYVAKDIANPRHHAEYAKQRALRRDCSVVLDCEGREFVWREEVTPLDVNYGPPAS